MSISTRIKRTALTAASTTLTILNNLQTANAQPNNRHTCYKLPDGRFDVLYCEPPALEAQQLNLLQEQCGIVVVPLNTSGCGDRRFEQYFYYETLAPGSKCELGSDVENGPGSCSVNVLKVNETSGTYVPQSLSPLPNGPSTDEDQMSLTTRIILISTLVLIMTLSISVTVGIILSRKNRNKNEDQSTHNEEAGLNRHLLDRNAPPSNYGNRGSAVAFKPAPVQPPSETIRRAHEALEDSVFEL